MGSLPRRRCVGVRPRLVSGSGSGPGSGLSVEVEVLVALKESVEGVVVVVVVVVAVAVVVVDAATADELCDIDALASTSHVSGRRVHRAGTVADWDVFSDFLLVLFFFLSFEVLSSARLSLVSPWESARSLFSASCTGASVWP